MEALLWVLLPGFAAVGTGLLAWFVMQSRMEVALAQQREQLAETRGTLDAERHALETTLETALRAVARKIHAKRQADPNGAGIPIDPEAEEVQQLKSAAMPLLFQLREDQKNEVRSLARIIGLERVASMI